MPDRLPPPGPSFLREHEVRIGDHAYRAGLSRPMTTDDGWWLLRASNTQAVLVARCEASSEPGLERLKAALVAQLEASGLEAPDFSGENAGH